MSGLARFDCYGAKYGEIRLSHDII